jgi:hypothetical protein
MQRSYRLKSFGPSNGPNPKVPGVDGRSSETCESTAGTRPSGGSTTIEV